MRHFLPLLLTLALPAQRDPLPVPFPVPVPMPGEIPIVPPIPSSVDVQDPQLPASRPASAPAPVVPAAPVVVEVPIAQITRLHGTMPVLVRGIGLVIGLSATGSSDAASRQLMANYIRNSKNVNIRDADLTKGSWAMVEVTATLQPFCKEGMPLDLGVATIGDATSLQGGILVETFLRGPDDAEYGVGSGPVSVSGFAAGEKGTRVQRNFPTVGRIPGGGRVLKDLEARFLSETGDLRLGLVNPSLYTAQHIAVGVNERLAKSGCRAGVVDENLVRIELPPDLRSDAGAIRILNDVRDVRVRVENPSTVVINIASGLVLVGEGVMISPCVVTLGDLTITVVSEEEVVQPLPGWSQGETAVVNRTRINVVNSATDVKPVAGGATVAELLGNLRALALTPQQMIAVFEALSSGGFLQAKLVKI
jgi:flagellar P-ring protein precursor FlgI